MFGTFQTRRETIFSRGMFRTHRVSGQTIANISIAQDENAPIPVNSVTMSPTSGFTLRNTPDACFIISVNIIAHVL